MVIKWNYHPAGARTTVSARCLFVQGIGVVLSTPNKYITYCVEWAGKCGSEPIFRGKRLKEFKCLMEVERGSISWYLRVPKGKISKMLLQGLRHQSENATGTYLFAFSSLEVPKAFVSCCFWIKTMSEVVTHPTKHKVQPRGDGDGAANPVLQGKPGICRYCMVGSREKEAAGLWSSKVIRDLPRKSFPNRNWGRLCALWNPHRYIAQWLIAYGSI